MNIKPNWPTGMAIVVAILASILLIMAVSVITGLLPYSLHIHGDLSIFGIVYLVIVAFAVGALALYVSARFYDGADFRYASYILAFVVLLPLLLYFFPRVILSLRGMAQQVPFPLYGEATLFVAIFVPAAIGFLWAGRRLSAKQAACKPEQG